MNYLIPILILIILVLSIFFKSNPFDSFIEGATYGFSILKNIIPYILAMIFLSQMILSSGIIEDLFPKNSFLSPLSILQFILKPFSSSGSSEMMLQIYSLEGVDNQNSIFSTLIQYSMDSSVYICSIYLGSQKKKITISLLVEVLLLNILSFFLCLLVICYLYF